MRAFDLKQTFQWTNTKIRLLTKSSTISSANKRALSSTMTRKSRSSSASSLSVVPPTEYKQFADALREFLPHSYQVEAMLRGHLRYGHLGILGASLWAPASLEHRHHLAVINPTCSTKDRCMFTIYWNEDHLSDDAVCHLLRQLPVGGWNQPILIRQMPLHLRPKLDAILLELSGGDLHLFATFPTNVYILTPEDTAPVPELAKEYYFGSLDSSYAKEIHQRWPESSTETLECFTTYLEKFPSEAIFYKSNAAEISENCKNNIKIDELVCYAVYKHSTDVGMTQTQENHRRKGLAQAATLKLAHRLHKAGLPVTGLSEVWHEPSNKLHASMGFKRYTDADFPFYFPKRFNFSDVGYASNFVKEYPESMKKWESFRDNTS